MKRIVLCRHAKSSWKYETEDIYRPLNRRGISNAPMMARGSADALPDLVLCSPAVRAYATALAYFWENQWPWHRLHIKPELFEADRDQLLALIVQCDDSLGSLWFFGHNPGLNDLLDYLKPNAIDNIITGGRVDVSLAIRCWRDLAKNVATQVEYHHPRGR